MRARSAPLRRTRATLPRLALLAGSVTIGGFLLGAMPVPIRWGYVDKLGHWAIPPQFDRADEFHDRLAKGSAKGEEFFIDKSGQRVGIRGSEDVSPFSEGLATVAARDRPVFFIDTTGQRGFDQTADSAGPFREGLARVELGKKWGYVDTRGRLVVKPVYPRAYDFSEALAGVELDETNWAFILKTGAMAIKPEQLRGLKFSGGFHEGLGVVSDGKMHDGYIDTSGKVIISPQFAIASEFHSGRARVVQKWPLDAGPGSSDYGFIDSSGNMAIKPLFAEAGDFHEGLARVRIDEQWGFVDVTGRFVIEPRFRAANDFREGFAVVLADGWVYVDKSGKVAFPSQGFDGAMSFSEGLAAVGTRAAEAPRYAPF
jgi:hypothetical protein